MSDDQEKLASRIRRSVGTAARDLRVSGEVTDLLSQVFTGEILGSIGKVLRDLIMLWCFLILTGYILNFVLPYSECVASCFARRAELCCPSDPLFVLRISSFLLVIMAGSFISTKLTRRKKLQHSAKVTVVLLISLSVLVPACGLSGGLISALAVVVCGVMFIGYRLSFRFRWMSST